MFWIKRNAGADVSRGPPKVARGWDFSYVFGPSPREEVFEKSKAYGECTWIGVAEEIFSPWSGGFFSGAPFIAIARGVLCVCEYCGGVRRWDDGRAALLWRLIAFTYRFFFFGSKKEDYGFICGTRASFCYYSFDFFRECCSWSKREK